MTTLFSDRMCGLVVALILCAASALNAQPVDTPRREGEARVDTLRVDTTGHEGFVLDRRLADSALSSREPLDSARKAQSRLPAAEGAPLGTLLDRMTPEAILIGKRDLVWLEYFTLFDVLERVMPAYPLSQGGAGGVRTFSYLGTDPSSVGLLFNGRPLRGAVGHGFDGENWPMEFTERVEILRGSRALLYGPDDGLIAVNVAQPRFDVEGSYARVWYRQGINNTTGGDITYSRNIGEAMNLVLGFRRMPSDGVLVNKNWDVTSWNGRGGVTWYPRQGLVISLTEIFTDATRGQNGGLTSASSRSAFDAVVENSSLRERRLRHDVTLAARLYPFTRPSVVGDLSFDDRLDSSLVLDASLYYTYDERDLSDSSIVDDMVGLVGARGALRWDTGDVLLEGNGNAELDDAGELDVDVGGLVSYDIDLRGISSADPFDVTIRGGARLYESFDGARLSIVGEGVIRRDSFALRGTLRATSILTEPVFDATRDSLRYFRDDRSPLIAEFEAKLDRGDLSLAVGGGVRLAVPRGARESYSLMSGSLRADVPLGNGLHLSNLAVVTIAPSTDARFPLVYDIAEFYGRWLLLKGNLDLRIGTTFQFQSAFEGSQYDPVAGEFMFPDNPLRPDKLLFPVWDAYAQVRLGAAYVRVSLRNILDNEFYTLYRYPIMGRGLYFGANWAFVD